MAAIYTPVLTYTFRDSLASGDPSKVIKGAYLDGEFNAIHTASLDAASLSQNNTFSGTQAFNNSIAIAVASGIGLSISGGSLVVGAATGSDKGVGTINAQGLYVNGVAVGTGSGSVTSVGLSSANSAITVSGSPITGSGTITITANQFTSTAPGIVPLSGGGTVEFLRADGTWAQVAAASVTGLAASATTDTTNAANISSGTLAAARLPSTISSNTTGNASTATNATTASQANTLFINGGYRTFTWSGQAGQPTYLWGSNDGITIEVWNPSNFSVSHASTSDSTSSYTGAVATSQLAASVYRQASLGSGVITFSTAAPSGGADGDIWFVYS